MENAEMHIAEQFALQTNRPFFLTGKAGTGKTTLLRNIASRTGKNFVVVAPTGVAAINAGGVTIHSMFNLPLTGFIPTSDHVDLNLITNRRHLAEHLKYRRDKLRVIQEMELLVIDEVSMVRADILDAIDFALRMVRKDTAPFGGVQVMLIGDMHQLPPVVKDNEWQILKQYYEGPYFFYSQVWQQLEAPQIELKKIYRQSDRHFLSLLNNIRHQRMEEEDYELLNSRYQPGFQPQSEGYILLSTHNRKADSVNEQELSRLDARSHLFEARITGDFPESMYPCDKVLHLKEGARVMFVRNDSEGGQYYNGKLATVKRIVGDSVTVTFEDGTDFELRREIWENISYRVDDAQEKIDKDELGTFSQYPLRLAWAITIHKSQGLTFDKVIIDAGQSFAAGQVYVALSRCRTLEGIVLHSQITPRALHGDERITAFTEAQQGYYELENMLADARKEYAGHLLRRLFSFDKLNGRMNEWRELIVEKEIPDKEKALQLFEEVYAALDELQGTAQKFRQQLNRILNDYENNPQTIDTLKERSDKAIAYFTDVIYNRLIVPLHAHIQAMAFKSRVKKYVQHVQALQENFWNKVAHLYEGVFMDEKLYTGEVKYRKEMLKVTVSSVTDAKKEKGGTYRDTLALYKQGKSIEEIAEMRSLAVSTIKSHFARWIGMGEIDIYHVLPSETIQPVKHYLLDNPTDKIAILLEHFNNQYDPGDLRMVVAHVERLKTEGV